MQIPNIPESYIFVFSDPVFNYTKYWRFLWDEITLPITYDSDWRMAHRIYVDDINNEMGAQSQGES